MHPSPDKKIRVIKYYIIYINIIKHINVLLSKNHQQIAGRAAAGNIRQIRGVMAGRGGASYRGPAPLAQPANKQPGEQQGFPAQQQQSIVYQQPGVFSYGSRKGLENYPQWGVI